jgi:hypothetical protein
MTEDLPTYLLSQGVLGVACLVLGYVCVRLYRENKELQGEIRQLYKDQLADNKEVAKDVTEVLRGNSQANLALAEKIEAVQGRRQ